MCGPHSFDLSGSQEDSFAGLF
jgi:hypothetical protein